MIQSKPKSQTLFSLLAFLVLLALGVGYSIAVYAPENPNDYPSGLYFAWWGLGSAIFLAVLLKISISYKKLTLEKGQLLVHYPVRFQKRLYQLDEDLEAWTEIVIKAKTGEFRQLEMRFTGKQLVAISRQENTSYEALKKHLQKKYGRLKASEK